MKLALYKAKGKIGNAFIRWWTNSQYSHCELVIDGLCYSSSVQDNGVRRKAIDLDPEKWDLIELPWADTEKAKRYFEASDEFKYGWLSLLSSQLFNRNRSNKNSQFCSEWCANALGLTNSSSYSPRTLGNMCLWLNGKLT